MNLFLLLLLLFLILIFVPSHLTHTSSPPTALEAAAAAGPILRDRPFVVVWNMPTAHCQRRYDVHLDLRDFDIVVNRQQDFQGQKMTIFYRDHLGMYPFISREGREVNGGIPQLGDLPGHLSLAVAQVSGLLRPNFTGLAVIDWEEWQPLWEKNFGARMEYRRLSKLLVRQGSPGLSDEAVTSLARRMFEAGARKFMEGTLRAAVAARPKGLWGFYGFPVCANKHRRKTDHSYTGRCHAGTRRQNDRLSWLWGRSAALYPSIYLPPRLAGSNRAALMVRHTLLEALRVASVWRSGGAPASATPVLPYARLAYARTVAFLSKKDLEHTLGESAALGAAGVVLWGETKFARSERQCILLRDYIRAVLGPFVRALRANARRCSLRLCHGNGRCSRRRLGSGHALTSDPGQDEHFRCRCYLGWTGRGCQDEVQDQRTSMETEER